MVVGQQNVVVVVGLDSGDFAVAQRRVAGAAVQQQQRPIGTAQSYGGVGPLGGQASSGPEKCDLQVAHPSVICRQVVGQRDGARVMFCSLSSQRL